MNTLKENRKRIKKIVKKLGKAVNSLNYFSLIMYKVDRFDLCDFDLDWRIQDAVIFFKNQYRVKPSYIDAQLYSNYSAFQEIRSYLIELRILKKEREIIEKEFKN